MCDPVKEISTGLTDLAKVSGTKAIGDSIAEGDLSKIGGKLSDDWSSTLGNAEWLKGAAMVGLAAYGGYALYTSYAAAGGAAAASAGTTTAGAGSVAGTTTAGAGAGSVAGASSQGAMLAGQTATFGAEGAAMTGQALAANTAVGANAANAAIMADYGATAASIAGSGSAASTANSMSQGFSNQTTVADAYANGGLKDAAMQAGSNVADGVSKAGNYTWNAAKGAYEWVAANPTATMAIGQGINSGLTYMTEQDKLAQAEKQQKDLMALEEQRRKSAATTVSTSGLLSRQMNANLGRA